MGIQLTQKERSLLQDQLKHEEICIEKYYNYALQSQNPELSNMFNKFAEQEQAHYNTISQLLQGQEPNLSGPSDNNPYNSRIEGKQTGLINEDDRKVCQDMLMTEAFVSNSYDQAIFQAVNSVVKQALQHIQREEQQHGEGLQSYLQQSSS
jgi:rubrerythrin